MQMKSSAVNQYYFMKMKIALFTFILSINNSLAQTVLDTDGLNNPNNIYLFSLKEYCKSLDSTNSKIVYVRSDHFIGDTWPKQIFSFDIKYLESNDDYINAIKENNGSVIIVGITPFDFRNGEFTCGIIPFSASYSNNNINLANGGGLTIYFKYDPKRHGLIYKNKKWKGI